MTDSPSNSSASSPTVDVFLNLSQVIAHTGDLGEMLRSAARVIQKSLDIENCSIMLLNADETALTIGASSSIPEEVWPRIRIPLGEGIVGRVAQTGESVLGQSAPEAAPTAGHRAGRYKTDSYVCVPLRAGEGIIGAVNATDRHDRRPLSERDLEMLEALAKLTALSVENHNLWKESRESQEHMAQLLQDLPVGMFTISPSGLLSLCNDAARRHLDLSPSLSVRQPWEEFFPEEVRPHIERAVQKLSRGQSSWTDEFELHDADTGEKRSVRLSALEAGGITSLGYRHVLFIVEDLNQMREILELRRSDQIKSNFLSLISHELRTPLASIKGGVHLLDQMAPADLREKAERIFSILYRNSDRLTRLVNNILDVLDLDTESLRLYRKRADVHELVRRVFNRYRQSVTSKQVQWDLALDAERSILSVDESRFIQVIDHVLENAVKFNPDGGRIRAHTHNEDERFVLSISNTGPRIEPDLHEKIFTKFYQVDASLTRECGGSGLGLYLCREIMRLHGGDIWVDPEFQDGARFMISLPEMMAEAVS